jgi:hypothetical protein
MGSVTNQNNRLLHRSLHQNAPEQYQYDIPGISANVLLAAIPDMAKANNATTNAAG